MSLINFVLGIFSRKINDPEKKRIEWAAPAPPENVVHEREQNIPDNVDIRSSHDIVFRVPEDMRSIAIQIQEQNGRLITEHTITSDGYFLAIGPGQKIRVKVNT